MTARVWINDRLVDPPEANLPYDDHGITVGDGAFETIKIVGGVPFALGRHLDRMARSLNALRLAAPDRALLEQAARTVAAEHETDGFLRLTVTAGPGPLGSPRGDAATTLIAAVRPGVLKHEPTAVITVPWTRNERGALTGVKSTSYAENVIALDAALADGADEALFANTVGQLCEGTGSNVFVVLDGELVTPPLASGCLAGITRELLLEVLPIREVDVPMDRLGDISEAFLTSTVREVQPIRRWDDRVLAAPGPLTTQARAVWLEHFGPGTDLEP